MTRISMVSDIMGLKKSILIPIELIFKNAMRKLFLFFSRIFFNAVFTSSRSETDSSPVPSSKTVADKQEVSQFSKTRQSFQVPQVHHLLFLPNGTLQVIFARH